MDDEQLDRLRTSAAATLQHCEGLFEEYPEDPRQQAYLAWVTAVAQAQATLFVGEELKRLREQRSGQ